MNLNKNSKSIALSRGASPIPPASVEADVVPDGDRLWEWEAFFGSVERGSLNLEQCITPTSSGGVSEIDYLRDCQVGNAKCSISTTLWICLGQFYSWWRLCAFTAKSEKVRSVTLSWLTLKLCACQKTRWKGPVECKRQRLENTLNFECMTYP